MPEHQQTIAVPQFNSTQLLALSYGIFQHLGWTTELATASRLIGYSKKTWGTHHDHILVDAEEENLTVTSKLPEGTAWDMMKKNKKNVARFMAALEVVKPVATAEQLQTWEMAVAALQQQTDETIANEEKEAAEVEAVMNLSAGSKILTYGIIGINILLFAAMIVKGVHLMEPQTADLLNWGANYKPLTTGGEWWRLLTSTFIHIGIIHLLFNMYALYQAGIYLEPMLGKDRFLVAYLCTGVLAGLCSTWWHGDQSVSAGASGAIFGLYGVFLALLTTKLIPKGMRKALLQSIGVFVVYNLLYGAGSQGVDNSAHLGGLLSGFLIGYLYFFTFKKAQFRPAFAMGLLIVATTLLSFTYLRSAHNDAGVYTQKIDEVLAIQEKAMAPVKNYTNDAELLSSLTTVSKVEWAKAKAIMTETGSYQLDENLVTHRQLMTEYIELRIKHNELSIKALQGKEDVSAELEEITKQINEKVEKMERK